MIRPAHFTGMSCTVYQRREGAGGSQVHDGIEFSLEQQLRFRCTTGTHNTSLNAFHLKVCLRFVCIPSIDPICLWNIHTLCTIVADILIIPMKKEVVNCIVGFFKDVLADH